MKKPAAKKSAGLPPSLLAAALRAQADGVFVAEAKSTARGLKILFVNESFCAMTGQAAAELVGRPHGALHVDKADVSKLTGWLRNAEPGKTLAGEGYLVRKDGGTIYAAWSFSAVVAARGRVSHVVATYRDTTEKRRLQEALVHSQRLDAVGRLAGGVAHDFNNLLSVINGYCEMLAAQVSDRPQALREVTEIHKSGLRAATLTRQLLAFGRRQPMDAHIINFNRIVQDNAEILKRLVGTAGRLELDLARKVGNVRADPTQFQQVLLNLVINARDALRDRGCITISTSNRDVRPGLNRRVTDVPPGHYVCLTIADNGTGMDADTQKHLFEPFFTTKPEGKGTGLGLALVYGIVQQSSGYISVRSALLAGSTFEILLPEVREPEEAPSPATPISPLPATRGSETLLIVEEDEVVRKMVAGMLTADGYRVLAAKNAAEGRKIAREQSSQSRPVQLLIAGLADGGEALARLLHEQLRELRVLCIGNYDAPETLPWLDANRQASLAKPFALSEILRSVRALLDA
ncbi:MAG TPA: ATP-binding protein [Opitutus sp.]|nr:ATP-binding protein [Opitutus sp.]